MCITKEIVSVSNKHLSYMACRLDAMQLLCCCYLLLLLAGGSSVVNGFTQVTGSAMITSQCGVQQDDPQLVAALRQVEQHIGPPGCNPPRNRSCLEILHCFPYVSSGYYQIQTANNSCVQIYCDMEGANCGGEGGWMRVAYVNMTQAGATCPQGLTQRTKSGLTLCGRSSSGCDGTVFSTLGLNYSRVCGQVRGYQQGSTDAFASSGSTVDSVFIDGVSITYGRSPRKHIWAYASGLFLSTKYNGENNCPCNSNVNIQISALIGDDYYCETGFNDNSGQCCSFDTLYINDTLWDGQQCVGAEAPCCTHPNMPWFIKTLNETTTEDIELRVCGSGLISNEDTPVEVIELFVY